MMTMLIQKIVLMLALALTAVGCSAELRRRMESERADCVTRIKVLGENLQKQCGKAIDLTAKMTADRMKILSENCHDYTLGDIADLLMQNEERLAEVARFFTRLSREKHYTMPKRSIQIMKFLKCIFEERVKGRGGIPHVCK